MKVHRAVTSILIIFLVTCLLSPCIVKADYPDGYYDVLRIIDGDTFELTNGQPVQLTGINATEIGEECSYEATQQLKSLIAGKSVYLEKDVSETNSYGWLLRYVYVDDTFVNYKLVFDGYAYAIEHPPDVRYATLFADAENDARSHKRGCLWADDSVSGVEVECFISTTFPGN